MNYPVYSSEEATLYNIVGYEVPMAVVMKSSIFWDIMPHTPFKVNRRFRGTCRLHFQGRRISQAKNSAYSR
jgi:hypothetical protein